MESSEIIVQEVFLMTDNAQKALELLESNRTAEARTLLQESLKRFRGQCNKNSTTLALQTLMDGFRPPPNQTTGMPAMHNPM